MSVRRGRYELLRVIASGGMATVHLGRALGAGGFERLVAVKVMHAHLAEEPEFVAMFLDEARLAARIRHPNVVGTLDIQQDEQGLFLVMDYVEGPSLQRLLRALAKKQRGPLPIDVALRIFLDALAGLHAAHELRGADGEPLNLVHRDVSPQNVLIGLDGVAQLTDFGVVHAESRLSTTRGGVVKGKVCYMAPEQIRAEPIDRRTDLYAAGALLWELLTGQRLVRGDNDGAMMDQILRGSHPPPRSVNPQVPEAIDAAAMRALRGAPADRYPTAAAFAEAIEAAAAKEGVAIATPRLLSTFVRGLVSTEDPTHTATPLSASKSLAAEAPVAGLEPSRERPVSGATPAPGVSSTQPALSTNAAVHTPSTDVAPRRSGGGRWAAAGVGALLVVGGGLLVTKGPLRVSWGDAPAAPAPTASAMAAPPEPPKSAPPPEPTATASASAAPPAAPTASASAPKPGAAAKAKGPLEPPARPRPEASPTAFRPKDL